MIVGGLEISGRQTGKTTRLVKRAKANFLTMPVTIVISDSWNIKSFRAQFRVYSEIKVISESEMPRDLADYEFDKGIWCFDEFDWFKRHVPVIKQAHYCTTARHLRDITANPTGDPLLELIKLYDGYKTVPLLAAPYIDVSGLVGNIAPELAPIFNGQVFKA